MSEWKVPVRVKPAEQFLELEVVLNNHDINSGSGRMLMFGLDDLVAVSGFGESNRPGRVHLRSGSRYDTTTSFRELKQILKRRSKRRV